MTRRAILFLYATLLVGCSRTSAFVEPLVMPDESIRKLTKRITRGPDAFLMAGQGQVSSVDLEIERRDGSIVVWSAARDETTVAWPMSVIDTSAGLFVASEGYNLGVEYVAVDRYVRNEWHRVPGANRLLDALPCNVLGKTTTLRTVARGRIALEEKEQLLGNDAFRKANQARFSDEVTNEMWTWARPPMVPEAPKPRIFLRRSVMQGCLDDSGRDEEVPMRPAVDFSPQQEFVDAAVVAPESSSPL